MHRFFPKLLLACLALHQFPQIALAQKTPPVPISEADARAAAQQAAEEASRVWLDLMDTGKFAESWEQASAVFKAGVTKEEWITAAARVRQPLGDIKQRNMRNATYGKGLPDLPETEYYKLEFDSAFSDMDPATETLLILLEKNAKWKVASYVIK